jgi:aminoglycoside phosphotransferase (APT) family kinase protein
MSAELVDQTRPVRDGEELDRDKLLAYLRRELDAPDGDLEIEQFPGGHSNLTYAIRFAGEDYVLRRPPFGSKVKSAHDMSREYRMLSRLAPSYPLAPAPVLLCDDESVLGCQFYVMQRLRGIILRKRAPDGLELDAARAATLCESFVDTFVGLHSLDYRALGLGDFGKPEGYVERQVTGWTKRYAGSKTDELPELDEVARWLAAHMPESPPATIIHNDFKFDNLVLDPADATRIIGILDWEMTTIGDPLMDLGTTLSYWVQDDDPDVMKMFGFGPTALPGMFTRRELADHYGERSGRDVANILFYYCYGLFKTAVVLQQIYYRYKQGLTHDERFGQFGMGVRILIDVAARAIDRGTL